MASETHSHDDLLHLEHRDDVAGRTGMWLFLFTEIMLFGALFIAYAVYRANYSVEFHASALHLNLAFGSFNTFVLLTSSLTMVLSITALRRNDRDLSICFLLSTIGLGLLFMVNKFFEWREKYHHGLFPGLEEITKLPHGESLFYYLYFVMTGLHGLHVLAGVTLLTVMLIWLIQGKFTPDRYLALDNSGLYWHLVDLVWIFLLPLFYVAT